MKIVFASMFRNSESYVPRYIAQVDALCAAAPQHSFRFILAEGDSGDATFEALKSRFNGGVFKCEHGGPVFGSTGEPERFKQMARVKQAIFERVTADDDAVIYVESDLIWQPETMLGLLKHLERTDVDCAVPLTWFQNRHFDLWGLRGPDGQGYGLHYPFHVSTLNDEVGGLVPISAAGSCLVMRGAMARACEFDPPELEIVGFTNNAVRRGFKLWVNINLKVHHPE